MTEEDIRRQKADALFNHREAKERAEHVRTRVRGIGEEIRILGARLEQKPEDFLPTHEIQGGSDTTTARLLNFTPSPNLTEIVNMDRIVVLAKELREAEQAVVSAAKTARNLGVSV